MIFHKDSPGGMKSVEGGRLSLRYAREYSPQHAVIELDSLRTCIQTKVSHVHRDERQGNSPVAKQKKKTMEQAVTVYH